MTKLVYSEPELMAEHAYAKPQVEEGHRLHGGFDAEGRYVSPRTLTRWPAVQAWQAALGQRGHQLIDASQRLLQRPNYPSFEQQKLLLEWGAGQTLWNSLTVTGAVEARGKNLASFPAPDFQPLVVEDIAGTCTGHLTKGLLKAHGFDEGGDGQQGGHDVMWFALRDMLFGRDAYPLPEIPPSLARPELGRLMPLIPQDHEQTILLLMNVLMIEIRAESFFSFCCTVMREPSLFRDRRDQAEHAAVMVERIRQDEAIHVAYLQTAVSELRSFTFKAADGRQVPGKAFIDPIWNGMVQWHSVTTPDHGRELSRAAIEARLTAMPGGAARFAQFDAVEQREAA